MQFCMDEPHSSTIKHECETMLTNLHYSIPSLDKFKMYRYLAKRCLLSSLRAHKKRLKNVNLKTRSKGEARSTLLRLYLSRVFFSVVVAELLPVHMYPMKMITANAFFENAFQVENFGATRCVPVLSPVV